jgi:hypothetical protein
MRNLNGYLKKVLLISSVLITFIFSYLFLFINSTSSNENFKIYSDFYHDWDGETQLSTTIYLTITTDDTPRVITFYTVTIPIENIKPEIHNIERNTQLDPTYYHRSGFTDIVIDLNNSVVSKEKPITLKLLLTSEISGENITLSSSVKDTISRTFSFTYPKEKGEITWSSTPVNKVNQKGNKVEVITAPPTTENVSITLGVPVQYSFLVSRNLINSSDEMISSDITLPPNTNNQILILESIEPKPDKSYKDLNGNYILQYQIAPQSNIEVSIKGFLKMEKTLSREFINISFERKNLWSLEDSALKRRINRYLQESSLNITEQFSSIEELESEDERKYLYSLLYRFVIDNLQPNTLTIGSLAGSTRLGGERALTEQANSTSEDYADSVITLYRYFGIPARLVLGYVTNISDYHPDGMYHYWAEYYDLTRQDWIIIDPFLEDYSNNSLWDRDLADHISLLYRYENPNTPKLAYYTENDFQATISKDTPQPIYDFEANFFFKPYKVVDSHLQGSIYIKNTGNTVLDGFEITKSNPDINEYLDYVENNASTILLPGDSHEIRFNIPSSEVEGDVFAVLKANSGTQNTEEKLIEVSLNLFESNFPLNMFSKLLSALIFFILAIPIYFIINKKYKKNG